MFNKVLIYNIELCLCQKKKDQLAHMHSYNQLFYGGKCENKNKNKIEEVKN